jgi:hypothetical protein
MGGKTIDVVTNRKHDCVDGGKLIAQNTCNGSDIERVLELNDLMLSWSSNLLGLNLWLKISSELLDEEFVLMV